MRSKTIAAAAIVAIGMGTGLTTVTAGPAAADPLADQQAEAMNQQFLKAVKSKGLRLTSDAFALDLAHSTCDVLGRGGSLNDAIVHVKNATEWTSQKDIGTFGSFALQAFCPTSLKNAS